MNYYIKRSVKEDGNPKVKGVYNTNLGKLNYHPFEWWDYNNNTQRPEYWLEEKTLPVTVTQNDFMELVDNDLPPNFVAANCLNLHQSSLIKACDERDREIERLKGIIELKDL